MDTSNEHMHIEQEREETVAAVVKNRAHRRAHGQCGTTYLPVAKHRSRGQRTESGPQRAQRRAATKGLRVGRPVRAVVGPAHGLNFPPAVEGRQYGQAHYAGPEGATPLERIDRMARYLLQRDVTTHVRHGATWRPTPRQRRRLDHKQRHAMAPFKRPEPGPAFTANGTPPPLFALELGTERAELATTPAQRANAAADAMVEQAKPRGFRIVDRRGEHRA